RAARRRELRRRDLSSQHDFGAGRRWLYDRHGLGAKPYGVVLHAPVASYAHGILHGADQAAIGDPPPGKSSLPPSADGLTFAIGLRRRCKAGRRGVRTIGANPTSSQLCTLGEGGRWVDLPHICFAAPANPRMWGHPERSLGFY